MAKIFYTSDTHFQHDRIIELSNRPFRDVAEMDDTLIRNWNSVVGPQDIVWHLGDFSLKLGQTERLAWIFHELAGIKRLILGNHDYRRHGEVHPNILALPWDRPPRDFVETTDGENQVVLCHYALRSWPGEHRGAYHFFGHSHGTLPAFGRSRDVGVDAPGMDFTPRTFAELAQGLD